MSQRHSEYARQSRDEYYTPAWVTQCLHPHIPKNMRIWEPACGNGQMVRALRAFSKEVVGTDITKKKNFLKIFDTSFEAIITNPPFGLAKEFIEHALELQKENRGMVAMLLRTDYDHAKTRQHLFGQCPAFAKKLVLTKRIIWFERPGAAPSFNHCWFLWNWKHKGPPTIAYGP